MRLRLTPRDGHFYALLGASAMHLVEGGKLLGELLGADEAGRQELAARMRDVEHRADESTHEITRRLTSTFVTPLDRVDIFALASSLDDCMDAMEAAAALMALYRVTELPVGVAEQVHVLQRQAELTMEAMPRLRAMKDLADYWVEVNRLENEADRIHRLMLGELFDGATDPIQVLKVKEVVDALDAAADAFERIAHTVERIAVKES